MVLLLLAAPVLLPEHRAEKFGRIDLPSAALSLTSILAIIYGVKVMAAYGVGPEALAAIVLGLLGTWVFIRRQRKLDDPLLDLGLLYQRTISVPIVIQTAAIFVGMAYFMFLSQSLQLVIGLTPVQAGMAMLPATVSGIVGSLGAPVLLGRFRPGSVMTGALVLTAFGFGLLSLPGAVDSLYILATGAAIFSLGITPVAMICTDMVVTAAPTDRTGSAAAMSKPVPNWVGHWALQFWAVSAQRSIATPCLIPTSPPISQPGRLMRSAVRWVVPCMRWVMPVSAWPVTSCYRPAQPSPTACR